MTFYLEDYGLIFVNFIMLNFRELALPKYGYCVQ